MTGFECYKMYLALKQHFTKLKYDYKLYNGRVRASEKAFEERRDRYFFKKLATKYSSEEMLGYFVSNFIDNPKGYLRDFSGDAYTKWKIHQESFGYKFKQDVYLLLDDYEFPFNEAFDKIFEVKSGQHPKLIKHYLADDVSLETLVVLDHCLGFVTEFSKVLSDPIWNDVKMKVVKYQPFLTIDCKSYKGMILDTIATKI